MIGNYLKWAAIILGIIAIAWIGHRLDSGGKAIERAQVLENTVKVQEKETKNAEEINKEQQALVDQAQKKIDELNIQLKESEKRDEFLSKFMCIPAADARRLLKR